MQAEPDYYEILQVHPTAEPEVIDAAFRRLARKYHPDVSKEAEAARRMREINAAYEILSDRTARAEYDGRRSRGASAADFTTGESPVDSTVGYGSPRSIRKTFLFWLRWVAVLPTAALSAILVTFPVHWAVLIFTGFAGNDDSIGLWDLPPETLERLGYAFFVPFSFVGLGARTAPAYKLHAAILLVILWAMVLGAAMMYTSTLGGLQGWDWARLASAIVLGVGGMIAGIYWVYDEERR